MPKLNAITSKSGMKLEKIPQKMIAGFRTNLDDTPESPIASAACPKADAIFFHKYKRISRADRFSKYLFYQFH